MRKILVAFCIICLTLIIYKYNFSNYSVEYKVNNYDIKTIYKDNRLYYEIDNKYNFDVYKNSYFKKYLISDIKVLEVSDYECILPVIDGIDTYPLCYKDGNMISYYLIDNDAVNIYKKYYDNNTLKVFDYYNNLSDYSAIWNYKGYYILHGNNYYNIELFKSDKYDNTLSFMYKDTIYTPNYEEDHTFSSLVSLNIKSRKTSKIELGYDIDYDSYIVGLYDDKIYLFDNKYSILYEFNPKKKKISIKGSNSKGYTKYEDGSEISCSKSEYKVNKIKYDNNYSIYKYIKDDSGVYRMVNDNNSIRTYINYDDINIIYEVNNTIYYVYKDGIYKYNDINGNEKIVTYNELEFNKDNKIFMYSD